MLTNRTNQSLSKVALMQALSAKDYATVKLMIGYPATNAQPLVSHKEHAQAVLEFLIKNQFYSSNYIMELLEYGADPDTKNKNGETLLSVFIERDKNLSKFMKKYHPSFALAFNLDPSYQIDYQKFNHTKQLGKGSNGTVFLGTLNGAEVAMKKLRSDKTWFSCEVVNFFNEISIMAELTTANSPYIVKLIGFAMQDYDCNIMMEYASRGSLGDIIKATLSQPIPWKIRSHFITYITMGLELIHSCKILHRDIKADNIVIDEHWQAKICDFGLSQKENTQTAVSGTPYYRPPQQLEPNSHPNTKASDIFSMIYVFLEIVSWQKINNILPKFKTQTELCKWLVEENRPSLPVKCPVKLASIITWGWKTDPKERPTATQIREKLLKSDEKEENQCRIL